MRYLTICFLFIFTLFSLNALATEQLILTVTSDGMDGTLELKVQTNDYDEVVGLTLYKQEDKDYKKSFRVEDFSKGVHLLKEGSHEVITLYSDDFDVTRGGFIRLDYLENAITGSRKEIELQVLNDTQKWGILFERSEVDKMFMEAKKIVFGKVVGIKKIHIKTPDLP